MSKNPPRLLILGQTPPPWHGQAVATKMLFEYDWPGIEVDTLRMAYSEEMDSVGRFSVQKVGHLFELIVETRKRLKANPGTILFYPPASAHWVPFLRDVVFLSTVRRLASGTVFIFHAGGLADFVFESLMRRFLGRLAYGKADLALEVSMEQLPPHEAFRIPRWEWCPCAAEVPEVVRTNPPADKPLDVLFVASLQEGKGVLEVIRTAQELVRQGHRDMCRFRVIGRWFSDEFRDQALALARELELEDVVVFPGELTGDAKWDAYAQADVFFFPTHYSSEASPIVIMEALGSGLPVVTTDWHGIPAMVEGCEAVELCPVKSPSDYATALLALSGRRGDFAEIGEKARSYYESRYQPEHFLGRIEKAIERIWWRDRRGLATDTAPSEPPAPDQLKLLQVFNQYTEQGGEELWVDEMSGLGDRRFRVDDLRFLSRDWKGRGAPSRFQQARKLWNNPDAREQLRERVEEERPDALILHNMIPVASIGMYEEAMNLEVPVLQYIHNFRPFSPSGTMWVKGQVDDSALRGDMLPEVLGHAWESSNLKTALLALSLRSLRSSGWLEAVTRWIAISDFMRDKFIAAGIPEQKIVTLRHCWRCMPEPPPDGEDDYYLFLGRLVPEKGVGTLFEAWEILKQRLGSACPRLVIAGTGPEDRRLRKLAAGNPAIDFTGFVSGEAKARALRRCRGVLAPSIWWEPLGLIVYEAYDHAKPVVAARSGGLTETVSDGVGGFTHQPGDAGDLALAVEKLEAVGPDGRRSMGLAGREWLLHHADPSRWRDSFVEIVKETISMKSRVGA